MDLFNNFWFWIIDQHELQAAPRKKYLMKYIYIYIILMKNNDEKLNKCEFVDELPIYGCIFYFKQKYI